MADARSAANPPLRFTLRGAQCRKEHVKGYTGPICACGPMECHAVRAFSESQRFDPPKEAS